jgi:4-hydroxybenzoate polyprenyltransferase
MTRWLVYQRERFPLLAHAPLIAAFSGSAVCFSSLTRGHTSWPAPWPVAVAFLTALLFFLQLRIADEFKDAEEDARHRPYRPVPRGLVSLRELGFVAIGSALVQLGLALTLDRSLVIVLAMVWAYMILMAREFFAAAWLKRHPLAYLAAHMAVVPLIDFYATACDWLVSGLTRPAEGLSWFLAVSFLNGIVVEIGRKTRPARDEEPGVDTYSALWGMAGAARAWVMAVALTALAAWRAADRIGTAVPMLILLTALTIVCAAAAWWTVRTALPGSGRTVELMSGVWTLVMYLGLGVAPIAVHDVWRDRAAAALREPLAVAASTVSRKFLP